MIALHDLGTYMLAVYYEQNNAGWFLTWTQNDHYVILEQYCTCITPHL